jgi:hypothetical protein
MERKVCSQILFNKLEEYFKDNIRLSFKKSDKLRDHNNIFVVTKNDLFYIIDINDENISSFIINNDNLFMDSMIIKELCYKGINDLIHSPKLNYMTAQSDRYVYYLDELKGKLLRSYESDEKIIDISCGVKHIILLKESGNVYEYVYREYPKDSLEAEFIKKEFPDEEKVVLISCGDCHSLALTESGCVYSWGNNRYGQLGVGNIQETNEPIIIELNEVKIEKISCGPFHSLLLSCDGNIYAFGRNAYGQVGCGEEEEQQRLPIKLTIENKFIDIASHSHFQISIALSVNSIYYVWGECGRWGEKVFKPKETDFKSLKDIFDKYCETSNKKVGNLIEFEDSIFRNGYYGQNFIENEEIGSGSFGTVFKVIKKNYLNSKTLSAIKKVEFNYIDINAIIKEYLNYSVIHKMEMKAYRYLVGQYDAWFENPKDNVLTLYIHMELCRKSLEDIIDEIHNDIRMKTDEYLTPIGYYITIQLFFEILESVDFLHTQNPPLIHRDLKPGNILLKEYSNSYRFVKIADFGLMATHDFSDPTHTSDKGTARYTAPEVISSRNYSTKADIYSVGVILKEMFELDSEGY